MVLDFALFKLPVAMGSSNNAALQRKFEDFCRANLEHDIVLAPEGLYSVNAPLGKSEVTAIKEFFKTHSKGRLIIPGTVLHLAIYAN